MVEGIPYILLKERHYHTRLYVKTVTDTQFFVELYLINLSPNIYTFYKDNEK